MTQSARCLAVVLCSSLLWTSAFAASDDNPGADNPYQGIVERNTFGLKPPPPPPDPEVNKPPLPKITLTGITTILGRKTVLMKTPGSPKPGQPTSERYYTLNEGQEDGEMRVLEIDDVGMSVKVEYGGTIVPLDFEKNGPPKPPSAPVPSPVGIPAPGNPAVQFPQFNPAVPGSPAAGMKAFPSRPLRLPGTAEGAANSGMIPGYLPGTTPTANVMPLPLGTAPVQQQAENVINPVHQLPTDQQALIIEAQHEAARMKGDPAAALFPPTLLNPTRNTGGQPDQQIGNPNQNPRPSLPIPGRPGLPPMPTPGSF